MGRQPLKTFFWVLTIPQSRLLARVQSGLYKHHDSFLTHTRLFEAWFLQH